MKVIRIDNESNYFVDAATGQKIRKYDPNKKLTLHAFIDGNGEIKVSSILFKTSKFGLPMFSFNCENYLVDDGYNPLLIRAGYIVKNEYDTIKSAKKFKDNIIERDEFRKRVIDTVKSNMDHSNFKENDNAGRFSWSMIDKGYKFTFVTDVIDNLIRYNQQRKELDLPFYPFLKTMDNFGTLYFRVFCEKVFSENEVDINDDIRLEIAEDYINKLILKLTSLDKDNNYKFDKMLVVRKISPLDTEI